jgi:hypothetical protein
MRRYAPACPRAPHAPRRHTRVPGRDRDPRSVRRAPREVSRATRSFRTRWLVPHRQLSAGPLDALSVECIGRGPAVVHTALMPDEP